MNGEKQGNFQHDNLDGGFGKPQGSESDMWNKMEKEIRKVSKDTSGEPRDFRFKDKKSWWWNENFQSKIRVKNDCLKNGLCVKMMKLEKSIRKLRTR